MRKTLLYLGAVIFVITGCDSVTDKTATNETTEIVTNAVQPNDLLIEPAKVGRISIGMRDSDVQAQYPASLVKKTTQQNEGMNYDAFQVYSFDQPDSVLFDVEMICTNNCKVNRLHVRSKKLKTTAGIGIGSTFSELQQTYPITYMGVGEGNVVAASEKVNMSFMLDASKIDAEKLPDLKAEDIPSDTKVVGILVL